eukprot:6177767-Pleurochrysis_carterae.AAC.3
MLDIRGGTDQHVPESRVRRHFQCAVRTERSVIQMAAILPNIPNVSMMGVDTYSRHLCAAMALRWTHALKICWASAPCSLLHCYIVLIAAMQYAPMQAKFSPALYATLAYRYEINYNQTLVKMIEKCRMQLYPPT